MKRILALAVLFAAADLSAARSIGFGADVFNMLVPGDQSVNVAFSPIAFEFDCASLATAMETIPRASVSETLGSLVGIESTYAPILGKLTNPTNGLPLLMARAFCLPDESKAQAMLRDELYRTYGTATCRLFPKEGAEAWLRTTMEGTFDGFRVGVDASRSDRYCFYDLVSFRTDWQCPFPTSETRRLPFFLFTGEKTECEFIRDTRVCDLWIAKDFQLLRLPLRGGADFYALQSTGKTSISDIRGDFSSVGIFDLLSAMKSVTVKGVWHGPVEIALPKMSVESRHSLMPALVTLRMPVSSLSRMGVRAVRDIEQHVRFSLDESSAGVPGEAQPAKVSGGAAKSAVFNRPFLFFIHHPPTSSLLVAGIYTGSEK